MPKTSYLTVDGMIMSETRSSEGRSRDYVHDSLGSVVGVYKEDWLQADASYDPYGEFLTAWNLEGGDYRFTWVGGWGYRRTKLEWSTHYVRARHYSFMDAAWTTVDPLWPNEMPYGYVNGWTMQKLDPTGAKPKIYGPYRFDPRRDCNCGSLKKSGASNVPNPTWTYLTIPSAGVPLSWRPTTSQDCFDNVCAMYCSSVESIKAYYKKLTDGCASGNIHTPGNAYAVNSYLLIPPCTNGDKYWKSCAEDWSNVSYWGARPHHSQYPEPSYYGTQDFCAVECIVRLCCAEQNALDDLLHPKRGYFRRMFDNCYFRFDVPGENGG